MTPPRSALIILAHGSRDPRWREPFQQLRERAGSAAYLAYLQLCQPDLATALRQARDDGAARAVVVPAFMSGGGHLLRDVPDLVARAAAELDDLEVTCAGALAEEPEVMEAMVRACERLRGER